MMLVVKIAWSMRGALLALFSFFNAMGGWVESLGISFHNMATFTMHIGVSIMQWIF